MRRTRHVVLPVRSWQYVGLLVVSLACLTFGLVSRDREGRHGSLVGPELVHTAPHEVDSCPNDNQVSYLLSTDSSSSFFKLIFAVPPTKTILSESCDSLMLVQSTRINKKSRLIPNQSDVTRLISNQINKRRLHESVVRRIRTKFTKYQINDENQNQRVKSFKTRDIHIRGQFEDHGISRLYKIHKQHDMRYSQIDKFKQDFRVVRRLAITNRRVDRFKIRFDRELYDSRSKKKLFINSELQKRWEIKNSIVLKLHVENKINSQVYPNSKNEDHPIRVSENRLIPQEKYRIISKEQRIYSTKNGLDFRVEHRSANTEFQRQGATNGYNSRVKNQRRKINENYKILNSEIKSPTFITEGKSIKVQENRWAHESQFLTRDKRSDTSQLEDRQRKSNKIIQTKENERRILKLKIRQYPLLKDISENRKNTFNQDIRNFKIRIFRIKNNDNHREISQSQNRGLFSTIESQTGKRPLVYKTWKRFSGINHRSSVTQQEMMKQVHKNRLFYDLKINRNILKVRTNNRVIDRIQLQKTPIKNAKSSQKILLNTIRENKHKNLLIVHRRKDPVFQKLRNISALKLQIVDPDHLQVTGFLDKNQIDENKLNEAQSEIEMKRNMNVHVGYVNLKSILMRFLKIKTTSMDPQYLKTAIMTNTLDYEILQKSIVIGFCTIYGASIFNGKTALIRNFIQYASRISIL